MVKSLTKGSPLKCILSFAAPVFLGMLFQQLYNMVDTMIVGRFLGLSPLAGVGATSSLYFLVIGSCNGICNGFGIPVAQAFGANDESELKRYVANSVWLSALLIVVLTAVTVIFCRNMLTLMNTPAESYEYSYMYIVIIFAGIPFTFLYNLTSSILRSLGDSRTPVIFLTVSSLLNIVLDLFFILVANMNVAGAALATVISQGISGVICLIYMMRHFPILKLSRDDWKLRRHSLNRLCVIGLPMGLQYSITAIGSVAIQTAVNSFGEIAVAGVTAANKVYALISCPQEAIGATMATYAGQNVGAGRIDRVSRGLFMACVTGIAISIVTLGAVLLWGRNFVTLFIDAAETGAIEHAMQFLTMSTSFLALLTLVCAVRFCIQGMGYSSFAMIAGVFEMFARCFVAFGFAKWFGFFGVTFSNPCAWLAADIFLVPAFLSCRKRVVTSAAYGKPSQEQE